MSIDLTKKIVAETYVNTMVEEAGTYLGYTTEDIYHRDPDLRPYTRNLAPAFLSSEEKKRENFHFVHQIITTVSALFSKLQADNAKKALMISENYNGAAHILKQGYHRDLIDVDHPIAKISDDFWKLTQKVKEIDTLRSKEATSYLHCIYAGTVGSTLLSIGVYAMNSWMKTVGKVALVFTLAFSGYTYYSHRGDHQKISKVYGEVGPLGEKIRHHLGFYNDDMTAMIVRAGSGTEYTPLFNEFKHEDLMTPLTLDQLAGINYLVLTAQK